MFFPTNCPKCNIILKLDLQYYLDEEWYRLQCIDCQYQITIFNDAITECLTLENFRINNNYSSFTNTFYFFIQSSGFGHHKRIEFNNRIDMRLSLNKIKQYMILA